MSPSPKEMLCWRCWYPREDHDGTTHPFEPISEELKKRDATIEDHAREINDLRYPADDSRQPVSPSLSTSSPELNWPTETERELAIGALITAEDDDEIDREWARLRELFARCESEMSRLLSENERLRATALTPEEAMAIATFDKAYERAGGAPLSPELLAKLRSLSGETK